VVAHGEEGMAMALLLKPGRQDVSDETRRDGEARPPCHIDVRLSVDGVEAR
jgi:hypothetical protein